MRRVSRRHWVLGGLSGLSTSCLSPTLPPLPPPNQPETQYLAEGLLRVEGRIPVREARVMLLNLDTSRLAGQLTRDQRYDFQIAAQPGHVLELWYEVGRERSDPVQVVAPPYLAASNADASTAPPNAMAVSEETSSAPPQAAALSEETSAVEPPVASDAGGLDAGAEDAAAR